MEGYELGLIKNQFVPKCYGLMQEPSLYWDIDTSFHSQPLINAGITKVNGAPLNLTGRGVVLAFIDTGIRYDLNVFRNPDGSTRILSIWDQTVQTGTPPADLMQWAVIDRGDRSINNVGLQNYFIRGARRSGNMDYPNREWGYGQLNVAGIFDVLATR